MSKIKVEYYHDVHEQILELHAAMQEIKSSGLTDEAIIVLLQNASKESKTSIKNVLYALENIDRYLK